MTCGCRCAHDADDRWTAEDCLAYLNAARGRRSDEAPLMSSSCSTISAAPVPHFGPGYGHDVRTLPTTKSCDAETAVAVPTAAAATSAAGAGNDTFKSVCKFIDNFCASGHFRGSAEMLSCSGPEIEVSFRFEKPIDPSKPLVHVYESLFPNPSWPERLFRWPEWLYIRKNVGEPPHASLTPWDCLAPDFYVKPPQANVRDNAQPRSIFLPRNLFCYGIGRTPTGITPGMLDVSNLTLLFQTEWFTVFRYCSPGESWIIK